MMADVKIGNSVVPETSALNFTVANQKADLEVNFSGRLSGKTELTIHPNNADLRTIRLDARQMTIRKVTVNEIPCTWIHDDPYDRLALHGEGGVNQHHILTQNITHALEVVPTKELVIRLPPQITIKEVNVTEVHSQGTGMLNISEVNSGPALPQSTQTLADASVSKFTVLTLAIEFSSKEIRDGLQFTNSRPGSGRWPCVFTSGKLGPGAASCIFPCLDALTQRYTWDISITCPKTVGYAKGQAMTQSGSQSGMIAKVDSNPRSSSQDEVEMIVLCSGDKMDEAQDQSDPTKKVASFSISDPLSPQQIGFAVGPFERVKLSDLRDAQQDERVSQNAVEMFAYSLPGRGKEVKNTCLPTPRAMDTISDKYLSCPFRTYNMCFVEDLTPDTVIFAGLTMCSTKLLYPEEVVDLAQDVTRILVHAIASQWVGITIVPMEPEDTWATVGIAHFMTDVFMKELCGNNEYRYRMKARSDLVCEIDRDRPSIYDLGSLLHVHPSEFEFLTIKAPLVLFVLDRRIAKVAGRSKMPSIIAKILTKARVGDLPNNLLSTEIFQRTIESFAHMKIDDFVNQWVKGAGCPRFQAFQRFNKKKLVVEMVITQVQGTQAVEKGLDVTTFMRDVYEEYNDVYAAPAQNVFTGPMTIRIHEADGTPYEHIVDIKEAKVAFDIPYSTKYKRLKRSKRQKKAAAGAAVDVEEGDGDSLVYCLGDVLQGEEEAIKWKLSDWSPEEESKMTMESYEWIRMDADFEWICRMQIQMPGYMFVSQLQQDRDVVAHMESVSQMSIYPANPLVSSFLLRTVMDRRYFYGVRTLAARCLAKHATEDTNYIGLFHLRRAFEDLFCLPDEDARMARPNDFSHLPSYYLQCAIVEAISKIRDDNGYSPKETKDFLLDKLRFNDNSVNNYSDAYYVSKLMLALCTAVAARPRHEIDQGDMDYDGRQQQIETSKLEQECLMEIDRYRRMDEWTDSFQNLYSKTALECQFILAKSGLGVLQPLHFLQYTRPGNFDMLRATAYKVLTESNLFESPSILRFVLHSMVTDPSPWLRARIRVEFGKAVGRQGIGSGSGIVIEMDSSFTGDGDIVMTGDDLTVQGGDEAKQTASEAAQKRNRDLSRRQALDGPNGALESLKRDLGENTALREAIWNAICQPSINLESLQELLLLCRILYDEVNTLTVTLDYPRYWKVDELGRGHLRFQRIEKVRTKVLPKWQPPAKPGLKLTFNKAKGSRSTTGTPAASPPPPPISQQQQPQPHVETSSVNPPRKLLLKISRPKQS